MSFDTYEYWKDFTPSRTFKECEDSEEGHSYVPRGRTYLKCKYCGDAIQRCW